MRSRRIVSTVLILLGLALCLLAARHYFRGWQAQREALSAFEAQEREPLAGISHARENPSVRRAAAEEPAPPEGKAPDIPATLPVNYPYGAPVARLKIPVARIDAIVFGGADQDVLEKGPGHVPGTELPGQRSELHNCVITGHRDSYFRHLGWLKEGSEVDLEASRQTVRYRVVSREIVTPDAVRVLAPTPSPRLTLITCYPFNYIGPAPKRLVVVAEPI